MNDVASHRAPPGPLAAFGARLGVGALVIAAIAVGGLVKSCTPDTDTSERPFTRAGARGDTVDARTFEVRVLDVRGATKISRYGKVRDSKGVWVLVKVRVVAHDEPTTIGYAALRDERDRVFVATDRISQPLAGTRPLQPGLPVEADIAFEVAADVRALSVRLAWSPLDRRMDAMAEIPLKVDRGTVEAWLGESKPAAVTDEQVVL